MKTYYLTNFESFTYKYTNNIIENFQQYNNYTILYRGDSQYIQNFEKEFFDPKAIYGLGLYLTDDIDVAKTYTLKDDVNNSVIFNEPCYFDNPDTETAHKWFIFGYLINKVNNLNISEQKLYDDFAEYEFYKQNIKNLYVDYINKKIDFKTFLDKFLWSGYYDNHIEEINDLEKYYKVKYEKHLSLEKEYEIYLKKATDFFNKNKDNFYFIIDSENYVKVTDLTLNKGYISEFKINNNILKDLYDANTIMDKDIISVLRKFFNRYIKQDNVSKEIKDFNQNQFTFKYFMKGNKRLSDFLYNNYTFRRQVTIVERKTWFYFINEMRKLGYKGIRYNGGEHSVTYHKDHNAYVIWNLDLVERIK